MKIVENNPFRILGVKANATPSEIRQQGNLIAQYLKIGQSAKLDFDITPPLSPLVRTTELIDLQKSRIHSTEDKVLHSLFWFVQDTGVDKIALGHLTKSKDIDKALLDFEKGCRGFVVSPDSYSAILNHSTLEIIAYSQHKDIEKLKSAIAHKFSIVSDAQSLSLLKKLVAPDGLTTSVSRILELAMPMLEELLSELVPSKNADKLMLEIFKDNAVIYSELRDDVILSKTRRIDGLVNDTEREREKLLSGQYTSNMLKEVPILGERLIQSAKGSLGEIENLLGKDDPVYTETVSKVYTEVNFCGVLPFNKLIGLVNQNISNNRSNDSIYRDCNLSGIIRLYDNAIGNLIGIAIPIKETMVRNRAGIKEEEKDLKPPPPPPRPRTPPPRPYTPVPTEPEGMSDQTIWLIVIGIIVVISIAMCN